MPVKRNYKRRAPRRRNYRKRRMFMRSPLQTRLLTRLTYGDDELTLNPAVGSCAGRIFSANGMYDPDITGVGHQPRGFDELMALYDHFTVIGAKITVDFVNTDTSNAMVCGIVTQDNNTLTTDIHDLLERKGFKYRQIGNKNGATANTCRITQVINPAKFLGRSKALSDPELKGSKVANPGEQAFFVPYVFSPAGADGGNVYLTVKIEYTAILHEPHQPGKS